MVYQNGNWKNWGYKALLSCGEMWVDCYTLVQFCPPLNFEFHHLFDPFSLMLDTINGLSYSETNYWRQFLEHRLFWNTSRTTPLMRIKILNAHGCIMNESEHFLSTLKTAPCMTPRLLAKITPHHLTGPWIKP